MFPEIYLIHKRQDNLIWPKADLVLGFDIGHKKIDSDNSNNYSFNNLTMFSSIASKAALASRS